MKNGKVILGVLALILIAGSAFSQKKGKYGATDEDSIQCVENLSLYIEFYKQKNYADAMSGWRWVYNNCPQSSKKMYANGAKMYKYLSKKEKDPVKKEKLVDTLMATYDQRIENFGQEGFVLGLKGEAYMQYRKDKVEEAYGILRKSVELTGKKSKAGPLTAYFQASILMLEKEKIGKEEVVGAFDVVSGHIAFQLDQLKDPKYEKKKQFYLTAKVNVELLFGPVATCEDLIKICGARFEENKANINWLKRGIRLMGKKECTEDPLFVKMAETLHNLEPSAESAYAMGKMMVSKAQHNKATTFFKQAVELQTEDDKKADYYLRMANHYFRNLQQPAQARAFAQKAAAARSGWGEPYIAIANYYAASAKNCGANDFEVAALYWVAVDKCVRAKSIDGNVTEDANKKIATWSKYFPGTKDAFFYGFTEGKPYTVECWINETTTVRLQ
ncbi:MAG TPA: hypothetical protein EYN71_05565 [Flavobacteriales bacterium]|nr:hypothetical protein [Flavobacteriales bacterium]HIO67786.1 hypothetical protein [Flavobacteriales bacterium]